MSLSKQPHFLSPVKYFIRTYLLSNDRRMKVEIKHVLKIVLSRSGLLDCAPVVSSVPLGTVLGPMLFLCTSMTSLYMSRLTYILS